MGPCRGQRGRNCFSFCLCAQGVPVSVPRSPRKWTWCWNGCPKPSQRGTVPSPGLCGSEPGLDSRLRQEVLWQGALGLLPRPGCPNDWSHLNPRHCVAREALERDTSAGCHLSGVFAPASPQLQRQSTLTGECWRTGAFTSPRVVWGGSLHLGRDTPTRGEKAVKGTIRAACWETRGRCRKQHMGTLAWVCPSCVERKRCHISEWSKNVSIINDPLGTHGPY